MKRNLADLEDKINYIKTKNPYPHWHSSWMHTRVNSINLKEKGYSSIPHHSKAKSITENLAMTDRTEYFQPLSISEENLRRLLPHKFNLEFKRISKYMYSIAGSIVKLLIDREGDVYVKTTDEIKPFNKFVNQIDSTKFKIIKKMKDSSKRCKNWFRNHEM